MNENEERMRRNSVFGMNSLMEVVVILTKFMDVMVGGACYVKEVDASKRTLRFYQEIYNEDGRLVEIHQKYPADKGHIKVEGGNR